MDTIQAHGLIRGSELGSVAVRVDPNTVRSVDRAASVLIALGEWDGEAGVSEIARKLRLHKSTASRLLNTLKKRGLVDQSVDSGKYRLGLTLVHLGGKAEKAIDLRSVAQRELESIARDLKAAASLAVLDGDSVMTIAWSDALGKGHAMTGRNLPLHATASGKVLLSNRPERDVIRLSKIGFTPFTPYTIVRADLLLGEIERVRRRGFATSFGEYQTAINAVAAPVFDQRAGVAAALEVKASSDRIPPSRVAELVERLRETATVITGRIGGTVEPA